MILVNGGTGICNCLYVDNLVDAMLLGIPSPPKLWDFQNKLTD